MRIYLASMTFDPLGFIEIDARPTTDAGAIRRRISRAATLDGGVAINNFGMTDADRTALIRFERSAELEGLTNRLFRLYAFATLSMRDGFYRVALESIALEGNDCVMTLMILERLNAD